MMAHGKHGGCDCAFEVDLLGRRQETSAPRVPFSRCACDDKAEPMAGGLGYSGSLPLGSRLTVDASSRSPAASLGAGGSGTSRVPGADRTDIAYGARPAVPERFLTEGGWALEADRRAGDALPPAPHAPQGFRWGRDPRELAPGAFSPMTMNPGLPSRGASYRGQVIPPIPAPQEVCIVNGFDPTWGTPPESVGGVPLRFSRELGAYEFDPVYAQQRADMDGVAVSRSTFNSLLDRWNKGLMLQPYLQQDSSNWKFRWIPRSRSVVCGDAAHTSASAVEASRASYSHQSTLMNPMTADMKHPMG